MDLLNINYEKYKLENGLEVILHQNDAIPLTSVNIWYKVGSANEKKGKTGIAHLFEHMMFQGSQNVPKEMHFRYIQEAGGNLNGSTSFDKTNYYEKVPANFLELIFWLESDRMGFLLPALTQEKLDNQKEVVFNERLERYDNQPYGTAWEKIITNLYPPAHPYSWPTIGLKDDIKGYTLDDITEFFETYYSPSNASIVVAGHFDKNEVKDLINKYFADIKGDKTPLHPSAVNGALKESIYLKEKESIQLERIYLAWPTAKAFDESDAALDILADILTGSKNARLYKKIVYENELAQDISSFQFSGKYAGHFLIIATAKPGVSLELLKENIFTELQLLCDSGVTKKELKRSKNQIKSGFIYSLQSLDTIADQLNFYNYYLGEPNSFNYDLKRYEDVKEKDIADALEKYLFKNYVELQISPIDK
jgi:zinc protease